MSEPKEPRSPRVQTSIAATLVDSDGGELNVEVIDLSGGGFRLRANEALVVGEEVQLRCLDTAISRRKSSGSGVRRPAAAS